MDHYKRVRGWIRQGRVLWLHGGPPRETFSRARRRDAYARARVLRAAAGPAGVHPRAERVIACEPAGHMDGQTR
eukprot:4990507-Alexandrium_andersonii.AAC.1